MYTNLSVDIQYKAPNFGQSLLLGVANAFGGCGSFGSLTGLGGFGGFMGSPVGIGMGCGSWSSQIGSILCGTAMNMAGMGYGGYGMGMYGCGGYSTDFAMAQAGAQLGAGLVSIGMNAIESRMARKSTRKALQAQTEARWKSLAEAQVKKDDPSIEMKINNAKAALSKAEEQCGIINSAQSTIAGKSAYITQLENQMRGENDETQKASIQKLIDDEKDAIKKEETKINNAKSVLAGLNLNVSLTSVNTTFILDAAKNNLKIATEEKDTAITKKVEEMKSHPQDFGLS